jgi:hypothetical protein
MKKIFSFLLISCFTIGLLASSAAQAVNWKQEGYRQTALFGYALTLGTKEANTAVDFQSWLSQTHIVTPTSCATLIARLNDITSDIKAEQKALLNSHDTNFEDNYAILCPLKYDSALLRAHATFLNLQNSDKMDPQVLSDSCANATTKMADLYTNDLNPSKCSGGLL